MKTLFELQASEIILSKQLDLYVQLLDELEIECKNLEGWQKQKFFERFKILDNLLDAIILYNEKVNLYVIYHPTDVSRIKEKLEIARRYITAKGLDWQNVTYGKLTDYSH